MRAQAQPREAAGTDVNVWARARTDHRLWPAGSHDGRRRGLSFRCASSRVELHVAVADGGGSDKAVVQRGTEVNVGEELGEDDRTHHLYDHQE